MTHRAEQHQADLAAIQRWLRESDDRPVVLQMPRQALLPILSLVQLACRHHHVVDDLRSFGREFVDAALRELPQDVARAMARGWDPEWDVPSAAEAATDCLDDGLRECRVCGCTEYQACHDDVTGAGCHWVDVDLCSVCERGLAQGAG